MDAPKSPPKISSPADLNQANRAFWEETNRALEPDLKKAGLMRVVYSELEVQAGRVRRATSAALRRKVIRNLPSFIEVVEIGKRRVLIRQDDVASTARSKRQSRFRSLRIKAVASDGAVGRRLTEFPMERGERWEQLEAAFRRLDFPAGPAREVHLRFGVNSLCDVDTAGTGVLPKCCREKHSKGGRPTNVRARAVSVITAYTYQQLTGKKPTRVVPVDDDDVTPRGPFVVLLFEVFRILKLKESPEYFAIRTINHWRRRARGKAP